MVRLVLGVIVVLASANACGAQHGREGEAEYLALRDKYVNAINARYEKDTSGVARAESLALRDLERHLRPLIGQFAVKGIADTGRADRIPPTRGSSPRRSGCSRTYQPVRQPHASSLSVDHDAPFPGSLTFPQREI